jgi:hypothetical protein
MRSGCAADAGVKTTLLSLSRGTRNAPKKKFWPVRYFRTALLAHKKFSPFSFLTKTHPKTPFGRYSLSLQPPKQNIIFPGYFVSYWFPQHISYIDVLSHWLLKAALHVGPATLPFRFHRRCYVRSRSNSRQDWDSHPTSDTRINLDIWLEYFSRIPQQQQR